MYAGDGSVMVTTGGIEMGQGLITKVGDFLSCAPLRFKLFCVSRLFK